MVVRVRNSTNDKNIDKKPTKYTPVEEVCGGVAQLGERLPCTQEAIGSSPFTSTIKKSEIFLWQGIQSIPQPKSFSLKNS